MQVIPGCPPRVEATSSCISRASCADGNIFKLKVKCLLPSLSFLYLLTFMSNNEQHNSCLGGRNWGESEAVRGGLTGPSWSLWAVPDIKGSPTSVLVGIPGNSGCFVLVCTIFRHWSLHADLAEEARRPLGRRGRGGGRGCKHSVHRKYYTTDIQKSMK